MRICIVGKYPPIEGGVSAQTYWLSRGLAARGHEVHVVTNGDEVEDFYRLTFKEDDGAWYQPAFPGGGMVRVYNATAFSFRAMGHIPQSNPMVSKLAALATDVTRFAQCDVILAYYFEPYCVAAYLASRWTGCRLLIKHAGSDLDRLFRVPDLATTYREILQTADRVVTQKRLMPRFIALGVRRERLRSDPPYSLPKLFNPRAEPLDLSAHALNGASSLVGAPVIGMYGKVGVSKGTFDLIATLGTLARERSAFRLALMIGDAQLKVVAKAIARAGLEDRLLALPMLPNWKVPGFLRACDAVCFLERDFPIAIHGPMIPREVFACGRCLILSQEIAAKQRYHDRLLDGQNVIIVGDPKNHTALGDALRSIMTDAARCKEIGARGADLSASLEVHHDEYLDAWEDLLWGTSPAVTTLLESADTSFRTMIPDIYAFLQRTYEPFVATFPSQISEDVVTDAIAFCEFVEAGLRESAEPLADRVLTVLGFAKARLRIGHLPADYSAVFPVTDRLGDRPLTSDAAGHLRPVKSLSVRVETFAFDVSAVRMLNSVRGAESLGSDGSDLAALEPQTMIVLFHRNANLSPCELRIDLATRDLVERCTGLLTINDLIESYCRQYAAVRAEDRAHVGGQICGALQRLHQAGVLAFGEFKPGWGWLGGVRVPDEAAPDISYQSHEVSS